MKPLLIINITTLIPFQNQFEEMSKEEEGSSLKPEIDSLESILQKEAHHEDIGAENAEKKETYGHETNMNDELVLIPAKVC